MKKTIHRLLSLFLVIALLVGIALPAGAQTSEISWSRVDNAAVSNPLRPVPAEKQEQTPLYTADEIVRVSITLEKPSTIEAGYSVDSITENAQAMAYRHALEAEQKLVATAIGEAIGAELDVVSSLTLLENMLSANVAFGQIARIETVRGVKRVQVETRYQPLEAGQSGADKPNMVISANMTGASIVWESGYTGAGTRVAIIDTGLDTDHQSFDPAALAYALQEDAKLANMDYEDYLAKIGVLTVEELEEKLPELHVASMHEGLTAAQLYVNLKAPFGFNYIDRDLDITHDNDSQGEHGSHVAGIAAANRYLKKGSGFVSAADSVFMLGDAPDCQIITMKVFGKNGGAYASDYMMAIEDAIVLGCDSVNLSLGSANPGYTFTDDETFDAILSRLEQTDMIVAMASGNDSYWASDATGPNPYLYIEDVNFQTAGSPGTYTNSLAVASVNNDGTIGSSLRVGEMTFGYSDGESGYNEPMSSLDTTGSGTEYDYVYLDGYGAAADFEGIDVAGKIVFVSRGELNFSEKAYNATSNGAIGVVVYNNQLATLIMNMTGFYGDEPCVFISQARGQAVRAQSEEQKTDSGKTYYTGKITVTAAFSANNENSPFYTMSAFTSWGVPGDLSMKPEITAPGGNIWSVNGAVPETDQYELMSGTSMATPQISGISALLMQHIREAELAQPGLTNRALAQSLLMSTAQPLKDENDLYYSILQQGAGLVDIEAAVAADSYILVENQPDGKVKAELGDDPDRDGVYSFSFTLHNLTDEERVYALSAEMFTQGYFEAAASETNSSKVRYLDTLTKYLDFTADFSADTSILTTAEGLENCDFDADGDVDRDDAQMLLDYVVGRESAIANAEYADVSGDGKVSTYDVHVFLTRMSGKSVTLPASGETTVEVTLRLTEEQKAELDEIYVNGAYVQAFVRVCGAADEEGVSGTAHTIPVLGFYGNWTDPSMFEIGSAQTNANGEEIRVPYTGSTNSNTLMGEYAANPGEEYSFGGNPVSPDPVYMPERNAYNNVVGNHLNSLMFNPLRNAVDSRVRVVNETTGELLYEDYPGAVGGPYMGVFLFFEVWYNATQEYKFTTWNPKSLKEGETFRVDMSLAPEYYLNADDSIRWDALGRGATLSIPMTIDNTAPEIQEVAVGLIGNTLRVTASDNRYVAGVALYTANGKELLASTGSKAEAQPGQSDIYELDLSKANGKKFLVQVYDYAYNVTTYELRMELGDVAALPQFIAYDREYDAYWTGFSMNSGRYDLTIYSESERVFNAATIYQGYVLACTTQGELYAMPQDDLLDEAFIRKLDVVLDDMAYNAYNDTVYAVAKDSEGVSQLYTLDPLDGTLTVVGAIGLDTNTLACDVKGTFYCHENGTGKVYSFGLDSLAAPTFLMECTIEQYDSNWELVETPLESRGNQAMEINPNNGKLIWTSYTYIDYGFFKSGISYVFEIDTEAKSAKRSTDLGHQLTALVIPNQSGGGSWADPSDEITDFILSHEEITMLQGNTMQVSATLLPWTLSDRSVTWSSKDASVATVNAYGLITAVGAGETTITATSNLDPSFSASMKVRVETLPVTLKGVLANISTNSRLFSWNAESLNWMDGLKLDVDNVLSATADGSGNAFVTSDAGMSMYKTNLATGESTFVAKREFGIYDLAYSPVFSTEEQDRIHIVVGSVWLPAKDPADAEDDAGYDLFDYLYEATGGVELIAIASAGACQYTDTTSGNTYDAELLYAIDDKGGIVRLYTFWDETYQDYTAGLEIFHSDLLEQGFTLTTNNDHLNLCSLVVGDDGNLYLANYTGKSSTIFQICYDESSERYSAVRFGNSAEDIWPVSLLRVTSNVAGTDGTASYASDTVLRRETSAAARALPVAVSENEAADDEVTIVLKAHDAAGNATASTNGLFTVSYDAALLELTEVSSNVELTAQQAAEGSLTLGYAAAAAIPADSVIATLTFKTHVGDTTDVLIGQTEVNDNTDLDWQETVTVTLPEGCAHAETELRNQKDASCFEDGYTGDLYCKDCGALLTQGELIPKNSDNCPSRGFVDVKQNQWYHEAIDYVVAAGLMNGMDATHFEPNSNMTRAQLVMVLYRISGEPTVENAEHPFQDVAENAWYADAVAWAYHEGVVNGISATRFAPDSSITREQLVTILYRFCAAEAVDEDCLSAFRDAHRISDYAKDAMNWAVSTGLIAGTSETTLSPLGNATRAQIATILMRLCEAD